MKPTSSYADVLKSSSLIGGSQAVSMLFGLVRSKLAAVLIGPVGIGLIGIFQSIIGLASALAGLGIRNSGVRDIAEATGCDDWQRAGRIALTLRRICWVTGTVGLVVLFCSAGVISKEAFNSMEHVWSIRLLGLTVLLGNIAGGQAAIIQGARRIDYIARIAIVGAVSSTIISAGFYLLLRIHGVVPALLSISVISLLVSTWYARKIDVPSVEMTWRESFILASGLVSLGLAFLWTALLGTVAAYLTTIFITREVGLQGVGIYIAAFTLSGLFVQFILRAMEADYYPRLTQLSNDEAKMNALINEQTEIGLLLAFPGFLATLAFAPFAIRVLYTPEFGQSAELLRWFVLGCLGRVIAWPMSYSILAKGKGLLFAMSETVFSVLLLGFIFLGLRLQGLVGVAIAYFVAYVVFLPFIFLLVRRLNCFSWSHEVQMLFGWMVPLVTLAFVLSVSLGPSSSVIAGGISTTVATLYCLRQLAIRVGSAHRFSRAIIALPGGRVLLPREF